MVLSPLVVSDAGLSEPDNLEQAIRQLAEDKDRDSYDHKIEEIKTNQGPRLFGAFCVKLLDKFLGIFCHSDSSSPGDVH